MTNTNNTTVNIRIVRADGSWRYNRLVWKVGDDRAYFASGSGFIIIADMYREGCEIKEGWV
jgi:hypothetical protein